MFKYIFFTVSFSIISSLILTSCNNQTLSTHKFTIQGFTQGTTYNITYEDSVKRITKKTIDSILIEFDNSCSIYNDSSLISKINNNTCDTLDSYIKECLNISKELYLISDSLFDITIKPIIEAHGFVAKKKLNEINLDSIIQFIGFDKISIQNNKLNKQDPRTEIDLNAIAQGYSVDVISRYFDKLDIKNYIVEIGGEVFARGKNYKGKRWRVGIDKPIDGTVNSAAGYMSIVKLNNLGLATSGNYRKFYISEDGQRINHTFNPKTGLTVASNLLSSTILAPSAMIADGYATVCMTVGLEKSIKILERDSTLYGMLVYSDGDSIKSYITPNLKDKIVREDY